MAIYNVPVIPLNLRKEETIIQIAESLNYLSDISNDIFKRVNTRIEKDTDHLNSLMNRITKVKGKISNISGAKKAIQVFSSSKYPATDLNTPYKTLFDNDNVPEKQKFSMKYKDFPTKDESLEPLQFYHLNFIDNQKRNYDGLGEIPKNNINNVNDLLLYNSGTNLYNKYIIADTLKIKQKAKKEVVSDGLEIGAAPVSISEPATIPKHTGENYFYSPDLGDVPAIDVPIDLPDLPGIADDLRYINPLDPAIAPSVIASPFCFDLPEVEETRLISELDCTTIETAKPKSPPLPDKIEPVPIPTPQPEILPTVIENSHVEPQIKETVSVAPPKPAIPDVHATLMDAIRKAGGVKTLKATEPRKEVETKKPTGGDLMADLHSKLLLRRKGISGAEKANDIEPGSAMGRISAMLPPPPAKSEQSETGTTDDDWED